MPTNHWWLGTTADPTVAANWSTAGSGGAPGVSVPGTGDEVEFDGNGNNPCTFVGNMTFLNMVLVVGYTAKLDLVTYNLTMDSGGGLTLDGGGEFDCGTGSHSITAGTLDNKDQTTFTCDTSTWTLNGACTIIGNIDNDFFNISINTGAVVTVDALTTSRVDISGQLEVKGQLILNDNFGINDTGIVIVRSTATISGASELRLLGSTSGKGLTIFEVGATISAPIRLNNVFSGSVLAAGIYDGLVIVDSAVAGSTILELDGTYNFDGGMEIEATGTGSTTLDNSVNNPIINVTDLTIDRDSGTIVIDDSATAVAWTITGDVIDEAAAGFTWTKGTGDITLSGSANQDIDFMDQTIADLIINKSAGTLTFSGDFTTDSFTGTSTGTGDFDPNSQTITITGNCSWAAAFDFNTGATTMDGCSWIIGGDFTADSQTFNATASWDLQVTGKAVVFGIATVAYSDASGGTTIFAYQGPTIDNGNNLNWWFQSMRRSMVVDKNEIDLPVTFGLIPGIII